SIPLVIICLFFLSSSGDQPDLRSFPTRRSSDLTTLRRVDLPEPFEPMIPTMRPRGSTRLTSRSAHISSPENRPRGRPRTKRSLTDRKSTRLNSSHVAISYAVFCLKKKINPSLD